LKEVYFNLVFESIENELGIDSITNRPGTGKEKRKFYINRKPIKLDAEEITRISGVLGGQGISGDFKYLEPLERIDIILKPLKDVKEFELSHDYDDRNIFEDIETAALFNISYPYVDESKSLGFIKFSTLCGTLCGVEGLLIIKKGKDCWEKSEYITVSVN